MKIKFKPEAGEMRHAVAASFDISGFSSFCRQPNAHAYLNRYLAALFDFFDASFEDGWRDFWEGGKNRTQVQRPDFIKYTGDGALMLWLRDSGEEFTSEFCTALVGAFRHFQLELPKNVAAWESHWRVPSLPKRARLGIALGPVNSLTSSNGSLFDETTDYAGYCINLAVRLQDHCPDVGFIVHQPVQPKLPKLLELDAKRMKGATDEPVYVFSDDFERFGTAYPKEAAAKFARKER